MGGLLSSTHWYQQNDERQKSKLEYEEEKWDDWFECYEHENKIENKSSSPHGCQILRIPDAGTVPLDWWLWKNRDKYDETKQDFLTPEHFIPPRILDGDDITVIMPIESEAFKLMNAWNIFEPKSHLALLMNSEILECSVTPDVKENLNHLCPTVQDMDQTNGVKLPSGHTSNGEQVESVQTNNSSSIGCNTTPQCTEACDTQTKPTQLSYIYYRFENAHRWMPKVEMSQALGLAACIMGCVVYSNTQFNSNGH